MRRGAARCHRRACPRRERSIRNGADAMTIAQVALPVAVAQTFDYWVPSGLAVERGSIVRVRLAKRRLIGVVTRVDARIENRAPRSIPIEERVALPALPADVIAQA